MPERSEQPPVAVHGQIARGLYRRQPNVAGEDCVFGGMGAHRLVHLLRVDQTLAGAARKIVERLARLRAVCGV